MQGYLYKVKLNNLLFCFEVQLNPINVCISRKVFIPNSIPFGKKFGRTNFSSWVAKAGRIITNLKSSVEKQKFGRDHAIPFGFPLITSLSFSASLHGFS